jgi:FtsP/CotA-like multicopper oxidase with cupredoxin domain
MTTSDKRRATPELGAALDAMVHRNLSRRNVLRLAGLGTVGAAAALVARSVPIRGLRPEAVAADVSTTYREIKLAATDGFIYVPGQVAGPSSVAYLPDPLSPMGDGSLPPGTDAPNMWAFGFRSVGDRVVNPPAADAVALSLSESAVVNQRGHFQASAPQLSVDESMDVHINLRNLGLSVRPDLTDSHTIHWHGFRNAIPLFDGVPELSIAVPIGRDFTYFYRPSSSGPGTYMYHCHFEDVEHISMGMTGIIYVRAAQNHGAPRTDAFGTPIPAARLAGGGSGAPMGYAYNDDVLPGTDHSTAYDREYGMFLSEAWAQEHFEGAHIQEHDWSEYHPDIWLLNGRSYPDTIAPPGGGTDSATGDLIAPVGHDELQYQPISSLITARPGDRVLLRFVNLGFQQHAMTIDGLRMRVVGKDATLLRRVLHGPTPTLDVTWQDYWTNTVLIGPGESVDAIVIAPSVADGTSYRLYNRNLAYLHNPGMAGALGGQMTEIRIDSGVGAQQEPNT